MTRKLLPACAASPSWEIHTQIPNARQENTREMPVFRAFMGRKLHSTFVMCLQVGFSFPEMQKHPVSRALISGCGVSQKDLFLYIALVGGPCDKDLRRFPI